MTPSPAGPRPVAAQWDCAALEALDDVRHDATEVRLTPPGRALAFVALAGFLPSLAIGGAVATVPAAAGALLIVAAAASWLNLRGARVAVQPFLRATTFERVVLRTVVRAGAAPLRDALVYHDRSEHVAARGLVAHVAGGAALELACPHRVPTRGHHTEHRTTLRSTYPFGLIERRQHFLQAVDHLSRPRLGTLGPDARRLVRAVAPGAEAGGGQRGWDEFHGLRPWREGEGTRLVHWRLSARTGRRVARELVGDDRPPVHLFLWTRVRGRATVRRHRALEEAVSLTASLARELLQRGARLRLTVVGATADDDLTVDGRRGPLAFEAMLDALARAERRTVGKSPTRDREFERPGGRRLERRVLVCAGHRPEGEFDAVIDAESRDVDLWFDSPYEWLGATRGA